MTALSSRIAVAILMLATFATGIAQERALDPRVFEIGAGLRCPTCVSESVAESSSAIAREMRLLIQDQLDAGSSQAEINAFFQERYGDWILLDPPRTGIMLVVWLLPIAALAIGAVALALLMRRWRAAAAETPPELDPADLARVRAALAAQPDVVDTGDTVDVDGRPLAPRPRA